ncbi:unnamed protein product [Urochloa humidicola]
MPSSRRQWLGVDPPPAAVGLTVAAGGLPSSCRRPPLSSLLPPVACRRRAARRRWLAVDAPPAAVGLAVDAPPATVWLAVAASGSPSSRRLPPVAHRRCAACRRGARRCRRWLAIVKLPASSGSSLLRRHRRHRDWLSTGSFWLIRHADWFELVVG